MPQHDNDGSPRRAAGRPSPAEVPQPAACLTTALAVLMGLAAFVGLFFLMLPVGGIIGLTAGLIVFLLCVVTLGHYWVWGRWLKRSLEAESEDQQPGDGQEVRPSPHETPRDDPRFGRRVE
jgi:hypothetical protein